MENVNTMNWLNAMSGNFATYMKNYVGGVPLFGITVDGKLFTLYPECNAMPNTGYIGGIQVLCLDVENLMVNNLQNKQYRAPVTGYPAYIAETNCVLFATEEERTARIKAYQNSPTKLVKAYASGLAAIINASYTALTVLNTDEQFYCLTNGSVTRLPAASDEQRDELIKKFNLDPQILDTNYAVAINVVIRNTRPTDGESNEVTVSSDIRLVPKKTVVEGEPFIQEIGGMFIFNGRKSAEKFTNTYGSMTKYLVAKALKATDERYQADLADVNDQASADKQAMLNTFLALGGTSLVSCLSENLIRSFNESDNDSDAIKKALKCFGIGIGAILAGISTYKLAKRLKIFEKKTIKQIEDTTTGDIKE